jgi:hypothetical protein
MGPGDANEGRGEWFRTFLRRPVTITLLVVGMSAGLLLGAHEGGPAGALIGPLSVLGAVLAGAWFLADRRAETLFWEHVRQSLGYEPFSDPTALETTTPLLHAGDRRFWNHEMTGPLGGTGLDARFAQYRYDVETGEDDKGEKSYRSYRFTVCLVELPGSMDPFRGIYLRSKRGVLGRLGHHDWLRGRRLREVEVESTRFTEQYELQIANDQDEMRMRELLDPKTIVWLAEHPLRPGLELRTGFLAVYVEDSLEDLGNIVWLLEATERLAERVQTEMRESAAASG